ncbi:MAG: hypothetical protein K8R77_09395 [Anaerolineaceae bacterium]|nr:hypothetical protein [Anaerolineaceae bacterium]
MQLLLNTLQQELPDLFRRLQSSLSVDLDPRFIGGIIGSDIRDQIHSRDAKIQALRSELSDANEKWKFYFDQLQKDPDFQLRKMFGQQCKEIEEAGRKIQELETALKDKARVFEYERTMAKNQIEGFEGKVKELNRVIAKQYHQLTQLIGDEYVDNQN